VGEWNDAKLAPVVAMTKGYSLYEDPQTGVMTAWIYGPISAILLLPAALATHPTTAGIIGCTIASMAFFVPTIWLLWRASVDQRILMLAAVLVVGWRVVGTEGLCRAVFIAGPDGPAMGLATVACAAIYRRRTLWTMAASAMAAILCIWTKHSFIPLIAALAGYIAIVDGLRRAGVYLALGAGIGVVVSGVLIPLFGASNMWFHMVKLPASHPFDVTSYSLSAFWSLSLLVLFMTCLIPLVLLTLVLLVDRLFVPSGSSIRSWFAARPWSMLLLVAIALVPLSMLSYMKVGGYVNNLAAPEHFLLLAALAGLLHICATAPRESFARTRVVLEAGIALLAVVLGLQSMITGPSGAYDVWPMVARPYTNGSERVFAYARAHPGEVYCPWNPLITLLADGKLYHFEWGLLDRTNARMAPTDKQLRTHVPESARLFVYVNRPQSSALHERLGTHRRRTESPEMPQAIVFMR
jgi:hypothetical protein